MPNPTDKLKRRRRLRVALAASVVVSALCMFAPAAPSVAELPVAAIAHLPLVAVADADAATYNVVACNDAGGLNHSWGQWWNSGVSTIASGQGCPNGGYDGNTNKGIFARYIANSTDPGGAAGGWVFNAPAGNTIASISLSDWFTRANTNGPYSFMASNFGLLEGCFNGSTICGAVYGQHTLPVNGATSIRTEVGCASTSCWDSSGIGTSGIFAIYGATVTINDNTAPSVSASGAMWTSGWQRGVRSVTVSGSDGSDGIQRNDALIDGKTIGSQPHGCDFSYVTPCPTNAGDSFNYDTHQLTDGPHTLQAVTYDAGWLSRSSSSTIYVDNNAPTRVSSPSVAGGETWHTSNSFNVSWTNPSQGSGAPIAAAHYSLCLASDPTNCPVTDKRVAGTSINSLSGISVPAPGDYLLKTWDEDSAGNVNPATASDPVHLMFDNQAPGAAQPAHANGWINAQDAKSYPEFIQLKPDAVTPVSGIAGYSITIDGSKPDNTAEAFGLKPTYRLDQLPEGRNILTVRAISNAGVPAADSDLGTTEIDVDKTPPTGDASGAPSPDHWQDHSITLQLSGTDQPNLSGMTAANSTLPVTAGGYISYSLDGGAQERLRGGKATVRVTTDGQHTLNYQAYDVAGNPSAEKSIRFRIDTTAPELVAFAARDAQDPRALAVVASDRTSGVADGTIQIRRVGSGAWTSLPTTKTADGRFVAHLDDSQLDRNAMYEARALVNDNAGNEAVGSAYSNGARVVFSGSLREQTKVIAQFPTVGCRKASKHSKDHRRRHSKRHAKRATVAEAKKHKAHKKAARCATAKRHPRRKAKKHAARKQHAPHKKHARHKKTAAPKKEAAASATSRRVAFGKRAKVQGTLTTASGAPLANADLTVDATLSMAGATPHRVGVVRTDANGHFVYDAPAGASRTLAFDYEGSNVLLPGSGSVTLRVPASASFQARPHVVRLHHRLTLSGKLRTMGAPLPKVGKLVYLQAFDRGKWRKFAVLRTGKGGSFRYRFSFEAPGSRGVTYRIKAVVPREAGYAFDNGASKQIKVRVR